MIYLCSLLYNDYSARGDILKIRNYKDEDKKEIYRLFYNTVHFINCRHYSLEEVDAWAKPIYNIDLDNFCERFKNTYTVVVELNHRIIGFSNVDDKGLIDMFYVHKNYQGIGVASKMFEALESYTRSKGIERLTSYVSITAKPVFIKKKFTIVEENKVRKDNISLTNFLMEKVLI